MWKLLRVWDYLIIYGWKTIFKTSVLILQENESMLLALPFEKVLSQLPSLPIKLLFPPQP